MATRRRSWSRCTAANSATPTSSPRRRTTGSSGRCATRTSSRCAGACRTSSASTSPLNGRQDYVGGYFVGSETYIPALDYFTAKDPVGWKYAFERQWLFYKLWGRLLYDPATPDSVFEAEFTRRYGAQGRDPAASLCTGVQHAAAPGVAVRLALGLHAVQRGLAGAAGRRNALHRRRRADQPADAWIPPTCPWPTS